MNDSQEAYIIPTANNMFTLWVLEGTSSGESDHITSPGASTAKMV